MLLDDVAVFTVFQTPAVAAAAARFGFEFGFDV